MKPIADAAAVATAHSEFLALKRKANRRKSNRDSANRRRQRQGNGAKPKQAPAVALLAPERKSWTPEEAAQWADALLLAIIAGGSLTGFCRDHPEGPQKSWWFEWLERDPTMAERYSRAREHSADTLADDCIAIADSVRDAGQFDSARVNAARLMVDARKWVASKLKPKTYADRLETVASGHLTVTHSVSDDDRAKALMSLLSRQAISGATSLPDAQRLIEATARDVTPTKPAKE